MSLPTEIRQDFSLVAGAFRRVVFAIKDDAAAPVDVSGWTLSFRLGPSRHRIVTTQEVEKANGVITRVNVDATTDGAQVDFLAADTEELRSGVYFHELTGTDPGGTPFSLARGEVEIRPSHVAAAPAELALLLTPEELARWANIPSEKREDVALIESIEAVTRRLEGRWGRKLSPASSSVVRYLENHEATVTLDLPDVVTLPATWVADDPKIEVRDLVTEGFLELDATEAVEEVLVDDDSGFFTRLVRVDGERWPVGENLIRLTYTTGYDLDTVPDDLRAALLWLAAMEYRDRVKAAGGSEIVSAIQVRRKEAGQQVVPSEVVATIQRWRPASRSSRELDLA